MRKIAAILLILFLPVVARSQVNLTLGLQAYYPFSGNANDASGNNNNPSFNNATLTSDRFGNPSSAYFFNGTDNYMRIPNSATLNQANQISLCAWVQVNGFYTGNCHGNSIMLKGNTDTDPGIYLIRFDDNFYTNGQNCVNPVVDVVHQNYYGINVAPPVAYTPYVQPGQWTSVIYTYDGTTAKLYVNCVLKMSGPISSLNFSNSFDLFFGKMNNPSFPYWFNGSMDEVRIYNRAINTDEVNALGGCATPIGNIINDYTPVLGLNPCDNKITVENGTAFNVGDTVMLIQMKGAVIDSTNTAAFGTITDYKNAGNYEFNYVKSKSGNIIELKNVLTRQYDIPVGKVQLVRVPYYQNVTVTSALTCLPWDGSKGGVLVLNALDSVILNANIDVSGKGFRGGIDPFSNPGSFNCYENQFYYPVNPDLASGKGEGIAEVSASKSFGKGALANGGGGGNSHNSGGGGGANAAAGGFGGYNFEGSPCDGIVPFDNRGIGGKVLTYSNAANKIFLGGGGGAGHSNNPEAFQAIGGNGSGLVIIMANKIKTNGFQVLANGGNAAICGGTGSGCHEGMGGGGAGGSVLLSINNYIGPSLVQIQGGSGGNMTAAGFMKVGPGGGGGGGNLWLTNPSLPVGVSVTVSGGPNGVCTAYANDPWGATSGQLATTLFNLSIPVDILPFKPNIDSVRIKDSVIGCNSFDFKGFGYTNTNPIATWQWYFGDGGTANTQNTTHTYLTTATFTVKLVITDINGCKDSISKNVIANCLMTPVSNIINNYTPVLAFDPCKNSITVEDGTAFNVGDTVLMIQMKGAVIDSTNTAAFGTITDYKNAGNYEFNYVKAKSGNIIELRNVLVRQYDIPVGKVQLIRVPYYQNANVVSTLTCPAWDGSKGGVLVVNVQDTVNLSANIDVSGKGFRGGNSPNTGSTTLYCSNNNYFYAAGNLAAAAKGESIAIIGNGIAWGKGSPSNGGGGGNGHNSGGGGGGNGSSGGFGGYQLLPCTGSAFDNRGLGGHTLTYNNVLNRIYLGGGGGAGHTDNAGGSNMEGGNGGGIIIIRSKVITPNGLKIAANGDNARQCNFATFSDCHDGSGGGGAGGTILIENNNYLTPTQIDAKGGKGGDLIIYNPPASADKIGPGGGGSGGVIWFNSPANPVNTSSALTFGANGVIVLNANDPWGATPGQTGISLFDLSIPVATVLFKPNIDSARIKDSATGCASFDFKGFGYTNTNPVSTWQWYFGDGGTANTQNTNHTYLNPGTFTVKLVVTDINGCKDSISKNVTAIKLNFDFGYQVNVCNPLSVQFSGTGPDNQNPYWLFGDGGNASTINTSHSYGSFGTYLVKYSVGNGVCTDTISKTINLSIIPDDIITTRDTTICLGVTKQLLTVPSLSFCWTPTTYLNNPNVPNPVTSTPQTITYYFTAEIAGNNVITNGNFSAGNTGFTSQYTFVNPNVTEGQYFVGPNPQAWNPSLSACTDHTTGTGNMMLVNGSPVADVKVWTQTVPVTANTNYAFSTWIQALFAANPAQLQFSINGNTVGSLITATLPTCTWTQFYTTWNSGNNTNAVISIVNKNTIVAGNDFALDDISFAPVLIKRDSVKITVDTAKVITNADTPICEGTSIQLNTTGASTYSWTPAAGLNNTGIANPIASPTVTTQYIVTGINSNGCTAKDSVWITVNPAPTITKSSDTTICQSGSAQLFASGGTTYSWSPAASLNNPSIPNPVASPSGNTMYYVTVTGANSCSKTDSIQVTVRTAASFSINPPGSVCKNSPIQLLASGGDLYSWTPAGSLDNPSIANPVATPAVTTPYSVQITDLLCNNVVTLSTMVTVLPSPTVNASRSNDIDCIVLQSQLIATGASTYSWSPAVTLSNPNSATPVATPAVTTQYTVTGTDISGCTNTANVIVKVSPTDNGGYLMPTAFTPNGDGKNDCYGIKYWGTITKLEFSVYNRWGERVFHTTQPGECWDGTYKGLRLDPDVFVYMVKATTTCRPEVFRKGTFALIR